MAADTVPSRGGHPLIVHGDDDQIVPIDISARQAAKIVKDVTLTIYPGGPHGITDTHRQQLNNDLLAFVNSYR